MMTKKRSAEKLLEISVDPPAAITLLMRKSVLYLKAFGVKTVLLNCAVAKVSTVMFITVGRRSFWKPVKSVYPVIPFGKPPPMKLNNYAPKPPP